jgi:hypothetical protein
MKIQELLKPYGIRRNLIISILLLLTGTVLIVVASLIGISDHLPGIILLFLGILMLTLAIVHHWRKSKSYQTMLIVSAIGFPVSAILHNLFGAAGNYFQGTPLFSQILNGLGVAFFFIAVAICPVAIIIGITGLIVFTTKEQNRKMRK